MTESNTLLRWMPFSEPIARNRGWRKFLMMPLGLCYLAYPASALLSGHHSLGLKAAGMVALAAFAACFLTIPMTVRDLEHPGRLAMPLFVVVGAMSVAFPYVFGYQWVVLGIYSSIVYAMGMPAPRALACAAAIGASLVVQAMVLGVPSSSMWVWLVDNVTLTLVFVSLRHTRVLVVQLRRARADNARLAVSEERLRIARDLHDLLGHSLSLIVLKSELAKRMAAKEGSAVADEIADVETVARRSLAEVRDAVSGYRQPGLASELEAARQVLGAAGIALHVRRGDTPLHSALDGIFGWAVREAVTNVVRHSRADRCDVELDVDDRRARLTVRDNGTGASETGFGNGLNGLGERVSALGGDLSAAPSPRGGFVLTIEAPMRDLTGANA